MSISIIIPLHKHNEKNPLLSQSLFFQTKMFFFFEKFSMTFFFKIENFLVLVQKILQIPLDEQRKKKSPIFPPKSNHRSFGSIGNHFFRLIILVFKTSGITFSQLFLHCKSSDLFLFFG